MNYYNKIVFAFRPSSTIPLHQEIPVNEAEEGVLSSDRQFLSQYQIDLIKETKTKESYSKAQLLKLAQFFGIKSELDKPQMVSEILRKWRERYPEDFEK